MSTRSDHHNTRFGMGTKTLKSYVIGLLLCLILTSLSFGLVVQTNIPAVGIYVGLALLAIVQLFVQVIFFLRLNTTRAGMWNSMSFIFALIVVAILVVGTMWIMYNMNYFMTH